MRKVIAIVGLALLFSGFAMSFASADPASPCPPGQPDEFEPGNPGQPRRPSGRPAYPPGECNLRLNKGVAAQGESVQAVGSGFGAGSTVRLELNGASVGQATADPQGAFTADFTVPSNAALGQGTVTATAGARQQFAALEVLAAAENARSSRGERTAAGALSRTGDDIGTLASIGGSLVMVGAVIVIAARRRRRELGVTA